MSVWNTLEIAKLVVSILTPVAIVFLGYWFNMRFQALERKREKENTTENSHCYYGFFMFTKHALSSLFFYSPL